MKEGESELWSGRKWVKVVFREEAKPVVRQPAVLYI